MTTIASTHRVECFGINARRSTWTAQRKIEEGEPLLASEISGLSLVAARQWLRAMQVKVSREINQDIVRLQGLLRDQLGSNDSWCKRQKS